MRVGSLFSGIGGIDLGLERAGMEIAWQVEIDEWCRRVLAKHWPDVPKFGDIRECGAHNLAAVDVLAGGPPCQPVSSAGKGGGEADARWLWPEFFRVLRELRPKYALMENPIGLFHRRRIAFVLGELAASGYDAEWDCIPAAAVGAPHLRDRVWILAYARHDGCAEQEKQQAQRAEVFDPGRSKNVADSNGEGRLEPARCFGDLGRRPSYSDWWSDEPGVARVAYGVPHGVDRRRGTGNAVVPQIVEYIGRRLREAIPGLQGDGRDE